jgi:flagellar biosynthesis/type III secretory pathway M-ring protein FliF/YscJ
MDNLNNFNIGVNASPDKFNKKQLIAGAAAILVLLIVGALVYFNRKNRTEIPPAAPQETAEERHMRELEQLRAQDSGQPLTEEEIQKQKEELNNLSEKQKPLTQEEADQHLEELNNLRAQ